LVRKAGFGSHVPALAEVDKRAANGGTEREHIMEFTIHLDPSRARDFGVDASEKTVPVLFQRCEIRMNMRCQSEAEGVLLVPASTDGDKESDNDRFHQAP
jgi:hypothetical protein